MKLPHLIRWARHYGLAPGEVFTICFLAIALLLAPLAAIAYWHRDYLRNEWALTYAKDRYQQKVGSVGDRLLTPVASRLAAFGMTKDQKSVTAPYCSIMGFSGFSETVVCTASWDTVAVPVDDTYVSRWQRESPALERYLLDDGWTKQWNRAQPIATILNREHDKPWGIGVNYDKTHDGIDCHVGIWRDLSQEGIKSISATTDCSRYVRYFGGY